MARTTPMSGASMPGGSRPSSLVASGSQAIASALPVTGLVCTEPGCVSGLAPYVCEGSSVIGFVCGRVVCSWHGALTCDGAHFYCAGHSIQRLVYDQGLPPDPDALDALGHAMRTGDRAALARAYGLIEVREWDNWQGVRLCEVTCEPRGPDERVRRWVMAL